ncbi:MAG TPA: hypothetical protein VFL27_02340 [Candidatus Dormibacteraeota bacterium]|nr:hypothetical protein [Candidatus Dormibacteraeota bacterium]
MTVKLETEYLIAIAGLIAGAGVGLAIGALRSGAVDRWDARLTLPLLLAAAGAHLVLISAVEPLRQVLFGLYTIALICVAVVAAAGVGIWRAGGVLLPAGSISAYFYFALQVHQADFVGLGVKTVELAAIVAVLAGLARARTTGGRRTVVA